MKKSNVVFLLLCIFQIFIFSTKCVYAKDVKIDKPNVLLINCIENNGINIEETIKGIYSELGNNVYLKIEYISLKDKKNEQKLYNLIKQSIDIYGEYDFIISVGEDATNFCIKYREDIFKDIPIAFLGVEDTEIINKALNQNLMSGISQISSIEENVELIKKYHKDVDSIVLIGNGITKKYSEVISTYKEFKFTYVDTNYLSKREVEEILGGLNTNDAIIQLSVKSFNDNTRLNRQEINEFIYRSNPHTPIYVTFSTDIGYGSIGGKVINPRLEGENIVKIAKDLLQGKDNREVYIDNYSLNRYIFDYDYLSKHRIVEEDVPANSTVLNSPNAFLEKYGHYIVIITILFLLLLFLVIGLMLCYYSSIKYKKAMELAMHEAEDISNLKKHLIYNISHELRTPIHVILSAVQLNKIKCMNNNFLKENIKNLDIIDDNCNRLLRIINNIIDIQELEEKRTELKLSYINIVELIENLVTSIIPYSNSKNLNIVFDTEKEEVFMNIDIDKLERAILNLMSNAIKFSNTNGNIKVNLKCEEDFYIIIEDDGIGIEKDKINDIFKVFTQVDNSLCRKNEGSGIGLSIVKYFVELHNGSIFVESEIGKGSKFIIKLPINTDIKELEKINTEKIYQKVKMELADIYI